MFQFTFVYSYTHPYRMDMHEIEQGYLHKDKGEDDATCR